MLTSLATIFAKQDADKKGFIDDAELELFKQSLISEEKLDSDYVQRKFSKIHLGTKHTLDEIQDLFIATPTRERSLSGEKPSSIPIPSKGQFGLNAIGLSTSEQVIPAARIIYILKNIKQKCDLDKTLDVDVTWCIEQLATGNIYQPISADTFSEFNISPKAPAKNLALPWLAQFSTPQLDMDEIQQLLQKNAATAVPQTPEQAEKKEKERVQRRSVIAKGVADDVKRLDFLNTVNSFSFDIISAEAVLGREKVLPLVAFKAFQEQEIFSKTGIEENSFVAFVHEIRKGYVSNPYHNDVHAADVMQMCHLMLTKGKVKEICKLTDLDVAALLLSAIVHDYKHPGVTNGFLINSNNELALAYNDKSVLESYHVSEAFKLMANNPDCDIFKNLTPNEKLLIRKRMINCVLGTDMALHGTMISRIKNLIVTHKISKGKNNSKIINPKEEFESKQLILDFCLHLSDIGNCARDFTVYKALVIKLMEEFGRQGDVEKSLKLPVSFLCDRSAVNVPGSQIGFIAGVTKPVFAMLVEIFPDLRPFMDNILANEAEWKKFAAKKN